MKRKRKKRVQIAVMYIIIWLLLICIGILLFLFIRRNRRINVIGEWEYNADYSDGVIYSVNDWLDDKEDIPFEFTTIKVVLSLNENNTYTSVVDENSLSQFKNDVYTYVEERFAKVVGDNLTLAGYDNSQDVNEVSKELITETIGGQLGPYLEENGVSIIPELSSIDKYVSSGTYELNKKEGIVTFTDNSGMIYKENVTVSDDVIVFTGDENGQYNPVAFSKKQ